MLTIEGSRKHRKFVVTLYAFLFVIFRQVNLAKWALHSVGLSFLQRCLKSININISLHHWHSFKMAEVLSLSVNV